MNRLVDTKSGSSWHMQARAALHPLGAPHLGEWNVLRIYTMHFHTCNVPWSLSSIHHPLDMMDIAGVS